MHIKFSHLQHQTDLIQILFLASAYTVNSIINSRVDNTALRLHREHGPRASDVSTQKSALIFLLLTENIWHLNIEGHAVGCCGNASKRYWRCLAKMEVNRQKNAIPFIQGKLIQLNERVFIKTSRWWQSVMLG